MLHDVLLIGILHLPESEKSYVDFVQYSANTTFTFNDITENDTLKLLQGLKTSKAAGPDKISARLVKDSAEVICQTLTLIFNRSLQQGIFPEMATKLTVATIDLFPYYQ